MNKDPRAEWPRRGIHSGASVIVPATRTRTGRSRSLHIHPCRIWTQSELICLIASSGLWRSASMRFNFSERLRIIFGLSGIVGQATAPCSAALAALCTLGAKRLYSSAVRVVIRVGSIPELEAVSSSSAVWYPVAHFTNSQANSFFLVAVESPRPNPAFKDARGWSPFFSTGSCTTSH